MSTTTKKTSSKKTNSLNIHQRLIEARKNCQQVLVKTEMAHARFTSITHDQVTEACRQALLDAGINFYSHNLKAEINGNTTFITADVTFVNVDSPEDSLTMSLVGSGTSNTGHGIGIALSYGYKYLFAKLMMIMSGTQDEADMYLTEQKLVPNKPKETGIDKCTPEQEQEVCALLGQALSVDPSVQSNMLKHFGVNDVSQLSRTQAAQSIQHLKDKYSNGGLS